MTNVHNIKPAADVIDDPIPEGQNIVAEAKALLGCVYSQVMSGASDNDAPDVPAAMSGILRLLDQAHVTLDPQQFRRAVMASKKAAAVSNANS